MIALLDSGPGHLIPWSKIVTIESTGSHLQAGCSQCYTWGVMPAGAAGGQEGGSQLKQLVVTLSPKLVAAVRAHITRALRSEGLLEGTLVSSAYTPAPVACPPTYLCAAAQLAWHAAACRRQVLAWLLRPQLPAACLHLLFAPGYVPVLPAGSCWMASFEPCRSYYP